MMKRSKISERHKRRLAKRELEDDLLRMQPIDSTVLVESSASVSFSNNTSISSEDEGESRAIDHTNFITQESDHSPTVDVSIEDEIISNATAYEHIPLTDEGEFVDNDNGENDYNESASDEDENKNLEDKDLAPALRDWALAFRIPLNAITALLRILSTCIAGLRLILPKDARSLLRTPWKTNNIIRLSGGLYYHFGLRNILQSFLEQYAIMNFQVESLNLLVNIDGLPLSKSSSACFWPILVSDDLLNRVYLVGLYYGSKKPEKSNEFLENFIQDLIPLIHEGLSHKQFRVAINVKAIVCDVPAKSFILNVKGHNGYSSCTKCTIHGEYINSKMCFPFEENPSALRTDEGFAQQTDTDYHQMEKTILSSVPNLRLVSNVAIDYMHLICLGVVKKLLLLWMKGPLNVRLGAYAKQKISAALVELRNTTPKEFSRRPRSLSEIAYWKATEFRQFLLYTGPIVLKSVLEENVYLHFLTLHVAISILIDPKLTAVERNIDYADKLLKHFVYSFGMIYGNEHVSHNVHNLVHLANDVRKLGPLDSFSAFRFENFLQTLKSSLRKSEKPLQQIIRRYAKMRQVDDFKWSACSKTNKLQFKRRHHAGPLINEIRNLVISQYRILILDSFVIDCVNNANNCLKTKDRKIIIAKNILKCHNSKIYVVGCECKKVDILYNMPCSSNKLDIFVVEEGKIVSVWSLDEIEGKMWKMPFQKKLCVIPLRHTSG